MIRQKINNGEGMLKLQNRGWVKAQLYDEKTDPIINPVDWQDWQADAIIYKPTKHDYKEIKNMSEPLVLKTVEDKIVDIRNSAREKLFEMKNKIELEEKRKIQLIEINDWTTNDEQGLTLQKDDYDKAIANYNNIKAQLMQTVNNEASFEAKKVELKDTFAKYNIKV